MNSALFPVFVAFAAAKLAAEIFERARLPVVVGELAVGVAVGPSVLNWVQVTPVMLLVAQLGVVVLLFQVGLATDPRSLRASGARATAVSTLGVALTFLPGFGVALLLGASRAEAAFAATALASTSAAISARVLSSKAASEVGRTILSAAIIDDILGLMLLTVVVGVSAATLSPGQIATLLVEAVVFVVVTAAAGPAILGRVSHLLEAPRIKRAPFAIALIVLLGLSVAAEKIGLAAIVGAFLAGVVLSGTNEHYDLEQQLEPLTDFLAPFFFVVTGAQVSVRALGRGDVLALALGITAVGVIGKVIAGAIGARGLGRSAALTVGIGMIPRGEVGIIVANLGLREGIIHANVFGATLLMVVASTLIGPPLLQRRLGKTS